MRVTSDFSAAEYYSVPEIAHFLDVRQRDVRSMINESFLVAVRRGENNAPMILGAQIVETERGFEVLKPLRGTVIQLTDLGLDNEEILDWLTTELDELKTTPLAALRQGNIKGVRRAAPTALA